MATRQSCNPSTVAQIVTALLSGKIIIGKAGTPVTVSRVKCSCQNGVDTGGPAKHE